MAGWAGLCSLIIVLSCVSDMLVDSKLSTYTPAFIQQPPLRLDTHARLATIPRTCAPSLHYAKGRDRRRIVEIPEKSTRNAQ